MCNSCISHVLSMYYQCISCTSRPSIKAISNVQTSRLLSWTESHAENYSLQDRVLPLSYDARTKGNKLLRWNANQRVRQHAFSNVTISSPNQISSIIYSRFGSNEFNQSTMSQKNEHYQM